MTLHQALLFRKKLDDLLSKLSIEESLENIILFEEWEIGHHYNRNTKRRYNGLLYNCEQAHVSQADWTPDITAALWTRVYEEEWPTWKAPTGAHDAYRIGKKVSHNDRHWINQLDYNIYEPGVYGWVEYIDNIE